MRGKTTEHAEQAAVIAWWGLACKAYKLPAYALFAIPNGAVLAGDAGRRAMQMSRLKGEGLRVGMLDLMLAVPSGSDSGLFIEMKIKPNKPSDEQIEIGDFLESRGYAVGVCYSAVEAIALITGHLAGVETIVKAMRG